MQFFIKFPPELIIDIFDYIICIIFVYFRISIHHIKWFQPCLRLFIHIQTCIPKNPV